MNDYYIKYQKYKSKYLELKNIENQVGGVHSYSNLYVLNKLNNIIERIPYKTFDEKIHIFVGDKELKKLSEKNNKNIKKFIKNQTKYANKYYHVSKNLFPYPILDKNKDETSWLGNGIYKNPQGIWFSCGLSWQNYIGNYPNPWSLATYIYEIEPSDRVLKISSVPELKKFINRYKKDKLKMTDIIDWKLVKEDYDGLIICPYLGDKIWGKNAIKFGLYGDGGKADEYINKIAGKDWENDIYFTAEWYRHWEEGTGVIWKPSSGLKNINLLTKLNTFDNL